MVKHARATHVAVDLVLVDGTARLTVTDDGVGVATADVARRLGEGHIGLASHALRVEAAGGTLTLAPGRSRAPSRRWSFPCRRQVGWPPTRHARRLLN